MAEWWQAWRRSWADRQTRAASAHKLYEVIVRQAREPLFYAEWGVPDTRAGRLEMVNLHAILAMRRLRTAGADGEDLGQSLFDLLFADLDQHLREWGVGDLSVGKHVKKLAESFFGRAKAIDRPLDEHDAAALAVVLERNVFEDRAGSAGCARRLADYLLAQERYLADADGILAGQLAFGPIGATASGHPGDG